MQQLCNFPGVSCNSSRRGHPVSMPRADAPTSNFPPACFSPSVPYSPALINSHACTSAPSQLCPAVTHTAPAPQAGPLLSHAVCASVSRGALKTSVVRPGPAQTQCPVASRAGPALTLLAASDNCGLARPGSSPVEQPHDKSGTPPVIGTKTIPITGCLVARSLPAYAYPDEEPGARSVAAARYNACSTAAA